MFANNEVDLGKLIELKNVDVQVNYEGKAPGTKGDIHQVNVMATLFDLNSRNKEGSPEVIKRVKVLGSGLSVEMAQDSALQKAQTLLGV